MKIFFPTWLVILTTLTSHAQSGVALLAALKSNSPTNRAAIIHALGEQRVTHAVGQLSAWLKDSDPLIASSAARALGEIGGAEAVGKLRAALKSSVARDAVVDGLLRCASRFASENDPAAAEKIFKQFANPNEKPPVRTAAHTGLIRCAGDKSLELIVAGINSDDTPRQIAAIQEARSVVDANTTATLTKLIPDRPAALQAALLGVLQQRGDPAAAAAVATFATNADAYVRVSAISALGVLGDAGAIPLLASAATSRDETEQKAARRALIELHRGDVGGVLVTQLASATPEVQAELARALAGRAEKSAVLQLIQLARTDSEPTRKAALRALSQLADGSHLAGLVTLIQSAGNDSMREQVRGVIESVVDRSDPGRTFDVTPILNALHTTNAATRIALLQTGALFSDGKLLAAMSVALKDGDESVRNAAARALCNSRDVGALKQLEELARSSPDLSLRVLALEGFVRLVREDAGGFAVPQRAQLLQTAFDLATRPEEKRLVLSALPSAPHSATLAIAQRARTQTDIAAEADIACAQIAKALPATKPAAAGGRLDPGGAKRDFTFKRIQLSDKFYAEGASVGDFNRDGNMDVAAGPFWFAGPDFTQRNEYRAVKEFDPLGYSDNFLTHIGDFNADGWPDIFCVPFPGAEGFWFENPAVKTGSWAKHLAYPMIGNESPGWVDMDGDGRLDLIFNNAGFLGYASYDPVKPDAVWVFHAVTPKDQRYGRFTHGIGAGDINGDGRMDLIEAAGWWEQPADLKNDAPWKFHPQQFAEAASQMLVTDVDGDGLNDVICSWHCHLYGLMWYRQTRAADGSMGWQQNILMSPKPDTNVVELRFSQLHAMTLADMNGDGLPDIVTGKRFWAHGPTGDVEPSAPAVLYWFELKRSANGIATFTPHLIDDDSGVGTQVTVFDINNDKKPDIIVANKKGIFLHLNTIQP